MWATMPLTSSEAILRSAGLRTFHQSNPTHVRGGAGGGVRDSSLDNDRSRTSSNGRHQAISKPVDRDSFVVERGAYEQFRNTR